MLVESAEETGGERIISDFSVERGGFVPGGEHLHDHCAEHFEVRAGRISFVIEGEERELAAGERLTVPPGTSSPPGFHQWCQVPGGTVEPRRGGGAPADPGGA